MNNRNLGGTLVFDIEVAFHPEVTQIALDYGVDEKKFTESRFGSVIEASMRYVSHISYKRDKDKVVNLSLLDGGGKLRGNDNEEQMLKEFIKQWNSSDEVVAHYGEKFDRRFLNSRIEKYGLPRLKPVRFIDTWRILKNNLLLPSNRLDSAIKYFKCPYEKPNIPWKVWQQTSLGVKKYIKILRNRCKYDVLSLAWLYYNHLQHYATGRVNKALAYEIHNIDDISIRRTLDTARCPRCGARGKMIRNGYKYSQASTRIQLLCKAKGCFEYPTAPIRKDGTIGRIK